MRKKILAVLLGIGAVFILSVSTIYAANGTLNKFHTYSGSFNYSGTFSLDADNLNYGYFIRVENKGNYTASYQSLQHILFRQRFLASDVVVSNKSDVSYVGGDIKVGSFKETNMYTMNVGNIAKGTYHYKISGTAKTGSGSSYSDLKAIYTVGYNQN